LAVEGKGGGGISQKKRHRQSPSFDCEGKKRKNEAGLLEERQEKKGKGGGER